MFVALKHEKGQDLAMTIDLQQMRKRLEEKQADTVNDQALLTEVQAALKRIDDGTYGYCVVCGQPIPERRLQAIPWAARCIKDEQQLEDRNLSEEETYDSNTY